MLLIVDDSINIRRYLAIILENAGHQAKAIICTIEILRPGSSRLGKEGCE